MNYRENQPTGLIGNRKSIAKWIIENESIIIALSAMILSLAFFGIIENP